VTLTTVTQLTTILADYIILEEVNKMKTCPYCNKELSTLGVVVCATMLLDSITGYSSVQEVEDTIGYYCPDCGADLDFDKASELANEMVEELEK